MAKLHNGLLQHGTALLAINQTEGKGQRGKKWLSAPGENVTMSTAVSIPALFSGHMLTGLQSYPFLLSAAVALACYDFTKAFEVPDIKIKWPNDIYFGDRKAGGILIENIYQKGNWLWAVVGTGININQATFDDPGRAVSVGLSTGKQYDVTSEGRRLKQELMTRLNWLRNASPQQVMVAYNSVLYRSGEEVRLKRLNATFSTTVRHVDISGRLHTSDVIDRVFDVGEVELVND